MRTALSEIWALAPAVAQQAAKANAPSNWRLFKSGSFPEVAASLITGSFVKFQKFIPYGII